MSTKPSLLFLCHRIPYPPNKGDKIRSYNFLIRLCKTFDVHLGCFIDDPQDAQYVPMLEKICLQVQAISITPILRTAVSATAFITGQPLSVRYYVSKRMTSWTSQMLETHEDSRILVFSSAMAQFIPAAYTRNAVVDFVDVDADKWAQYAESKSFPMSWVYRREAQLLRAHDDAVAIQSAQSLFVSDTEAQFFIGENKALKDIVTVVPNGVDTEFFSPDAEMDPVDVAEGPRLTFIGAMDYWANVDAVMWFVEEILPDIHHSFPDTTLYIVGSNPTAAVQALTKANSRVVVTGRVEDVRPYLQQAHVLIAPMRIARGVQNKVLEGMACAKQIVCTTNAIEGIDGGAAIIEDEPFRQAAAIVALLRASEEPVPNPANREFVLDKFSWQVSVEQLTAILQRS